MPLSQEIFEKLVNKMGNFKLFLCFLLTLFFIFLFLAPEFFEYQTMTHETIERMQTINSQSGDR